MKSISEINLLEILPQSIRNDEKVIAVANALTLELQKLSMQSKLPLHLPRIDELDHPVLDKLAEGYHVDFY